VSLNGIEEYSRGVRSFYKQGAAVGEVVCTAVTAPDTITVVWRNYGTVNIGPGFDLAPYVARAQTQCRPLSTASVHTSHLSRVHCVCCRYLCTTIFTTSASDGGLIVKQEDKFEVNNVDLIKYNLFKSNRPALPPIDSVACPLPKKG
jgi:hypothetical protein